MNLTFDNNCNQLKLMLLKRKKLTQWHSMSSIKPVIKKVLPWFPRQQTVKAKREVEVNEE